MPIDPSDPEYTLHWPPHLFADEVSRLVEAARSGSWDDRWEQEVESLLRQAFVGEEPLETFRSLLSGPTRLERYDGEEPF